jgi:hypothetical protein
VRGGCAGRSPSPAVPGLTRDLDGQVGATPEFVADVSRGVSKLSHASKDMWIVCMIRSVSARIFRMRW